jgi:hypothetical protein
MTKAAALALIVLVSTFGFSSDWQCAEAHSAMLQAVRAWPGDGEGAFWASDTFLFIAATCPHEFFASITPKVFDEWLVGLESRSGLAMSEPKAREKEIFLAGFAKNLRRLRLPDKRRDVLRARTLKIVSSMCVRVVDHLAARGPCRR